MINDYAGIPLQTIEEKGSTLLFSLLEKGDEETFSQHCAESRDQLDKLHENYRSTCLQLACQKGLPKAVKALLMNGADPNNNYYLNLSPIMMAGLRGYYDIVEMLAQHKKVCYESTERGTVLHTLLEGMAKAREKGDSSFVMEKCINCIEALLKKYPDSLDIDAIRKEDSFTALRLAVKLKAKRIILLLLKYGTYIGSRCSEGYTPISFMNADVFEEYLNYCIYTKSEVPSYSTNYKITYNYSFLVPLWFYLGKPKICQGNHNLVSQTKPLIEISRALQLRHLLKHPVLASFLHMKWYILKKYFWVNFSFYLTFWLCLTLHSLALYSPHYSEGESVVWWIQYPSIALCGLLSLREVFKFSISPTQYVSNWENLLNVALLMSNLLVIYCGKGDAGVAAIALLLTWTKMMLLINRHPLMSSNFEIYKAVCASFLKVLASWSILIVAFALSFSLLFKDDEEHPRCTQNNTNMENNICKEDFSKFFNYTMTSFFKVIIMMTGEFDSNSIPFCKYPGVSHVLFILFVFLVSIVLFNLMIGLAVSDTQTIRNVSKVVGYVNLAKQILSIETMVINCLKMFDRLLCGMLSNLIRRERVTATLLPNKLFQAFLYPNRRDYQRRAMIRTTGRSKFSVSWMVPEIVDETKKILQEKETKREENEHSSNSLKRYSEKLEKCSEKLETYSERLLEYESRILQEQKSIKEENKHFSNSLNRFSEKLEIFSEKLETYIQKN